MTPLTDIFACQPHDVALKARAPKEEILPRTYKCLLIGLRRESLVTLGVKG